MTLKICLLAIPRHLVQNISTSKNGSAVLQGGFSLWDALYFFMPRQSEDITFSVTAFFQSPTVVDQYLPLALVA